MLPQTRSRNTTVQSEQQFSNQGFCASRSGTPAPGAPAYSADLAAARSSSQQMSALQPSFRPVLQAKHSRPMSREAGISARAAAQHATSDLHLMHTTRQPKLDRPLSHTASRSPATTQHAMRRNTASQASSSQQPAIVQRQQSARPGSGHQSQSATAHAACECSS